MRVSPGGEPAGGTQPARGDRARRGLRDFPSVVWLGAAALVAVLHPWVPAATWLMIHLVLLGALTHAILVWSEHFAQALLRSPATEGGRRAQARRIGLLMAGSLGVFVGVPTGWWWVTLVGATLAVAAVTWHAAHLWRDLRRALPGRFRVTLHYYLGAAAALTLGAGLGATLAWGLDDTWHGRVLVAHTMANLLGWVGLTVTGTLVTLWPTMLRTRMDARADLLARQALPLFAAALVVLTAGALLGWREVAFVGLAVYTAGLAWWGRALWRPLRAKPPREFAPASVAAAMVWGLVAVAEVGVLLATSPGWSEVADRFPSVSTVVVVGFAAQLLTGALSYLMPSVLGGGPSVVRAGQAWFNRGATVRLTVINGGLLLCLLPVPGWVRVALSVAVLAALAAFVPLMLGGVRASVRARRALHRDARDVTSPAERAPQRDSAWSWRGLVAGLAALAVAVGGGLALDPTAAGIGAPPAAAKGVPPTGRTTTLTVTAVGMSFSPRSVTVPAGDRLVIELVNRDETTVHDLLIGSARTPRLAPGERATLDLGIVTAPAQGWCTVVGHRQAGMTFDVLVEGSAAASAPSPGGTTASALSRIVDPTLPPLGSARVHRVTLRVQERPLEVAPGVWQRRWTYNGGPVGPTLHGHVGDRFEVTLINDGSMGHSIDFHAGALAPDRPMRTIPPGGSLRYTFTAQRAGMWMYHCSTAPLSSHIAAGMHGAVVIEPEGLDAVDRSYVVVQSEVYLAGAAASPAEAAEVNADRVAAETPDRVVFNGVAGQYYQRPFEARVGERVRFWVLAAGPNHPASFHIVGGQFDTVYLEGAYRLRRGRGAFGERGGGSQALGLQPAQGGFVELTFPEAGRYPVVSHLMADAERGASGVVAVRP